MSLIAVAMPNWISRLLAPRAAAPASRSMPSRIEICPPQLWASSLGWRGRLRGWLRRSRPARPCRRLARVKHEFHAATAGLPAALLDGLGHRIERARSLREFWHLRSPLYNALARGIDQVELDRRLACGSARRAGPPDRTGTLAARVLAPALAAVQRARARHRPGRGRAPARPAEPPFPDPRAARSGRVGAGLRARLTSRSGNRLFPARPRRGAAARTPWCSGSRSWAAPNARGRIVPRTLAGRDCASPA